MHSQNSPSNEENWEDIYLPFSFTRPTFSRPSSLQTQETPQDVTHSPTQQHSLLKRREKGHLLLLAPVSRECDWKASRICPLIHSAYCCGDSTSAKRYICMLLRWSCPLSQFIADSDDDWKDADGKEGVGTEMTENRDVQTIHVGWF